MARKLKLPHTKHINDLQGRELIWGPPDVIRTAEELRPYQNWMADKIEELPGLLLGAEMGLGKTAATLRAYRRLRDRRTVSKGLIVAPLHVAEGTWPEEIATWDFSRDLTFRVVTGSEEERREALFGSGPRDLTIVNRENLFWLYKTVFRERWPWDFVAYDEISRLKAGVHLSNPKPRADGTVPQPRLTEMGVIGQVRGRIKKFVGLSGTPAPNGLIDLYGPMYAVDGGERLGRSRNAYIQRWFIQDAYTYGVTPRVNAEEEILDRIKDRFFSLREADYLTLPPLIEVDHKVKLEPAAQDRYRELEREMAIQLRNCRNEEEVIEAVNGGVLTGKLLQFANGSLYTSEKEAIPVHTKKLEKLESIYYEAMGKPILVAYSFQFDRDAIKKKFGNSCVIFSGDRDRQAWNRGEIPMLLIHPGSAGHGLNFQKGSNIACFYGLPWSYELYWQFVKRLHRSGQLSDRVILHRIITERTLDTTILPVLRSRMADETRIKIAVKAYLGSYA